MPTPNSLHRRLDRLDDADDALVAAINSHMSSMAWPLDEGAPA